MDFEALIPSTGNELEIGSANQYAEGLPHGSGLKCEIIYHVLGLHLVCCWINSVSALFGLST